MSIKNKINAGKSLIASAVKDTYQYVRYRRGCVNRYVFIVGCQRSGTTMLGRCFDRDYQVREYGEYGLSRNGLRIPPLAEVRNIAARQHAPVFVAKPLVESQNTADLLDYFDNSSAIWMLRHYKDVANSSQKRFGMEATLRNLGSIVDDDRSHWMAEKVSDEVRSVVRKHFRTDMHPLDGKALIWYARNSLFFDQQLENHDRVKVVPYDSMVAEPDLMMREIYEFCGIQYPGDSLVTGVHRQSVGLGKKVDISEEIASLCNSLWRRFQVCRDRRYQ